MAVTKGTRKRPQGAGAHAEQLKVRIDPERRARVRRAALALGISEAMYVDRLLSREELDETGRPVWWPDDENPYQEVLPVAM